ncbi:MAG: hypothetical protein GY938_05545, partial [Ketobacter sp.]|nr:hypothetical protein [Ketobacter sp.]
KPEEVLSNNLPQAINAHHKLFKRLEQRGAVAAFDAEIQDGVSRGVWRKATAADLDYKGPVNYIVLTEAFKESEGATTPVRVCLDASRKKNGASLNSILVPGPSRLANQLEILLDFRAKRIAMCLDFSKFYQSVNVSPEDAHLLRVVWSAVPGGAPEVYVGQVNNFGLVPAGPVASIALNLTADMHESLNPEAAEIIRRKKYVDDIASGGRNIQHTVDIENGIQQIASKGSFHLKPAIRSFDDVEPQKLLGVNWLVRTDKLSVKCDVNIHAKIKGARVAPDVDLDILDLPAEITRRIVWRVAMSPYDPYGLISVIIIQLKLVMRLLATLSVSKDGWDQLVSDEASAEFTRACKNLAGARKIEFARCVLPVKITGNPQLVVFVDGSTRAMCAIVYIRWRIQENVYQSFLVCSKCKVAPKTATTVPRTELVSAQIGVRLAATVMKSMTDLIFEDNVYLTDSSAVMGMLRAESGSLNQFTGHSIAEVREA